MVNVRGNRREIDLAVLRSNMAAIRRSIPAETQLMAVVKADAYGHGMIPVAKAVLLSGADQLAVATVEEGILLRESGITVPVLVLGATSPAEGEAGTAAGLTMTVCDPSMVQAIEAAATRQGRTACVHMKIDTGMSRIGARTEAEVLALLDALAEAPHVRLTGAFTHFADADGNDMAFTHQQLTRFRALTSLLPENVLCHCANSAAIHRLPEACTGMVRAGITLYGYPPVPTDMPVKPFMRWVTEVTYVKEIQTGDTVSYGRTFTAEKPMRVATIACGYGDGYHRAASGRAEVLIGGKRAKVLGRICMDQMMADVTDIPGVKASDPVVLMGTMGSETISAEDIAGWAGTISYEVLLAATGRVPREWLHADA